MPNTRHPFEPDTIYHLYNHGNGDDLIFRETENYRYFLKRFKVYISHIAWTYAYCLMPNHFHFLIRIKNDEELVNYFIERYPEKLKSIIGDRSLAKSRSAMSLERHCGSFGVNFRIDFNPVKKNFLISYSKSFNKMYDRRGSLFLDNINRIPVRDDEYFTNMIRYIHYNPVLHGFTDSLLHWKFNSFHTYFSEKRSMINREDVIDWFGGAKEFRKFHQSIQEDKFDAIKHLTIE